MGDGADAAMDQMMDWDEITLQGYYEDPDNREDGDFEMWSFSKGQRRQAKTFWSRPLSYLRRRNRPS